MPGGWWAPDHSARSGRDRRRDRLLRPPARPRGRDHLPQPGRVDVSTGQGVEWLRVQCEAEWGAARVHPWIRPLVKKEVNRLTSLPPAVHIVKTNLSRSLSKGFPMFPSLRTPLSTVCLTVLVAGLSACGSAERAARPAPHREPPRPDSRLWRAPKEAPPENRPPMASRHPPR